MGWPLVRGTGILPSMRDGGGGGIIFMEAETPLLTMSQKSSASSFLSKMHFLEKPQERSN